MAEAQKEGEETFVFPDEKDPPSKDAGAENETDINIEVVDDTPESDRGHKPGVSKDITDVTDDGQRPEADQRAELCTARRAARQRSQPARAAGAGEGGAGGV